MVEPRCHPIDQLYHRNQVETVKVMVLTWLALLVEKA